MEVYPLSQHTTLFYDTSRKQKTSGLSTIKTYHMICMQSDSRKPWRSSTITAYHDINDTPWRYIHYHSIPHDFMTQAETFRKSWRPSTITAYHDINDTSRDSWKPWRYSHYHSIPHDFYDKRQLKTLEVYSLSKNKNSVVKNQRNHLSVMLSVLHVRH